jgi:hypothetical protein
LKRAWFSWLSLSLSLFWILISQQFWFLTIFVFTWFVVVVVAVRKPQLIDEIYFFKELASAQINRGGINYSAMSLSFTKVPYTPLFFSDYLFAIVDFWFWYWLLIINVLVFGFDFDYRFSFSFDIWSSILIFDFDYRFSFVFDIWLLIWIFGVDCQYLSLDFDSLTW